MCLGVPGRVVSLDTDDPHLVVVDVAGATQTINLALIDDGLDIGDWVVIHMGFAVEKLSEEEARDALEVLNMIRPDADVEPTHKGEPPSW